jgi:hypothetical protein
VSQTDRDLLWLAGVGALLLALVAGVESAGLAGGFFASGHPVPLSLPDAAATLARLTRHLGVSAWPAADQRWLPKTMTAALAVGSLVALALSAAGVRVVARVAGPVGGDGARFARAGDLRPLRMRPSVAHGIPLGHHEGHELAGEPNASVALCGPRRSESHWPRSCARS